MEKRIRDLNKGRVVEIQVKEISTILSIHHHLITELYGLSDYVCLHFEFQDEYCI